MVFVLRNLADDHRRADVAGLDLAGMDEITPHNRLEDGNDGKKSHQF